jgi:hypothetical protein
MADQATSSNSTLQQVKSAQNANKTHNWPDQAGKCTPESWAIYTLNQCFRSHEDWNVADLFELARISGVQAMAVAEFEKMQQEGVLIYGGKTGMTKIENPRNRAINTLNGTITATLRRLGITSSNSGGDRTAKTNRAVQERDVERVRDGQKDKNQSLI